MRSTFNILFYLKKSSVKKTGYAPLMVRITINGVSAPFSLKAEAKPGDWDTKAGRLRGRTKEANDLNSFLDNVRSKIRRHYQELCDRESNVTATMVRDAFLGLNTQKDTLLCLFDRFNADMKTLVGKEIANSTHKRYVNTREKLYQFLQKKRKREDIPLKEISPELVTDFERFLFVDCKFQRITALKTMKHFKRVVVLAHNNGWLSINPFATYKFKYQTTDRGYLSEDELMTLMKQSIENLHVEYARDVFVFCCFSGLSHIDVMALREEHIQRSFDDQVWIKIKRRKTNVQSEIPLLPIAQQILDKYKGKCSNGMLLPVPHNGVGNKRLRELGEQCKIPVKVTFHLARHTFATTVTLGKGVPIESVSKMLGHRSVKTTQIYARIVNSKVSSDMAVLLPKLSNFETVYTQKQVS